MDEVLKEKRDNMRKEKTVDTLNKLVQINNDRIEGYEKAFENTDESDLKSLFNNFAKTSRKCIQELSGEITSLGGTPIEGSKSSGKFFRAWMEFKSALSGDERKAIFNSCIYGEENAIETYKKVLTEDLEYLNSEQQIMIGAQLASIRANYDRIKTLHDTLVES